MYNNYGKVTAVAVKDERLYQMKWRKLQANISRMYMIVKEKLHRTYKF
jgi:hypothetical protein